MAEGALKRKIKNILIVEDNDSIRTTLVRSFGVMKHPHGNGYVIKAVGSADEALPIISSGGIDLVITDLQMPGMNGDELVKEIKKQFPHIQTVLASGTYLDGDLSRVKQETGTDYVLKKPYEFDTLSCLMKELEGNEP